MSRELEYTVLDVFAERALEGNQLAVFHDARGLSDAQMQALARETNLSETAFVLPSEDPEEDRREGVRVRIFTTEEELPFAGHPTLGTSSWLHLNHPPVRGAETVTLRLKVGPIPVRFEPSALGEVAVYGTMRQRDPEFGSEHDPAEVARILGMAVEDLLPGYRPQTVSTGNAFCIVAIKSVEALGRLDIPHREATAWLRERGIRWFYCIAPEPETNGWRARMQWHSGEDPATGSAAGPCIAWLVRTGLAPSGLPMTLRQGVEIQRPSLLTVQAKNLGNAVTDVFVAGRTIPVAAGRFLLPD
jgi:trans-2,3-dihydro-3-hydroxyanthranilate isomerase